ncbi:hypothetical protein DPEC_G00278260 [Dallia pectoralis]|uniref:Uncharacterized protein n=1 Tax=Dallia pectoralis TaxID=75939 RepID=A0ACC2FM81_DALPE|nr:hypothetical protein DPEC_G00278260 [Dallia pectoralis]
MLRYRLPHSRRITALRLKSRGAEVFGSSRGLPPAVCSVEVQGGMELGHSVAYSPVHVSVQTDANEFPLDMAAGALISCRRSVT